MFAENIPYGPTNLNTSKLLDPARLSKLPTAPENLAVSMQINSEFWLEHGEDLEQRFNAWAAK